MPLYRYADGIPTEVLPTIIVVGQLGDEVPLWSFDFTPEVYERIANVFKKARWVGAYYPYWMEVA